MKVSEIKDFFNNLPSKYDDFDCVNGQVGQMDKDDEDSVVFRVDNDITTLYVDTTSKELCFFHQSMDEISKILPEHLK